MTFTQLTKCTLFERKRRIALFFCNIMNPMGLRSRIGWSTICYIWYH